MLKRTLYFSNPARLSLKNLQLVYSPKEGEGRTVPIEDLGFVVVEDQQISISLPLLNALIDNNVAVVFCNEKHMPVSMLLNLDGHTVQSELFAHQLAASEPLKKNLWKQTIEAKIKNQAALLNKLNMNTDGLHALARDVKSGDVSNREAQAARLYWGRLFGQGFIRDRYGTHPNMLLNYGYTILRAAVARGLIGSGLLATLGIHHHNRYNSFCLADDIMEPYRPFVDEVVYHIYHVQPAMDELNTAAKLKLLEVLTADVMMNKLMRPLMVAISLTTASLARCFSLEIKKINFPAFVGS